MDDLRLERREQRDVQDAHEELRGDRDLDGDHETHRGAGRGVAELDQQVEDADAAGDRERGMDPAHADEDRGDRCLVNVHLVGQRQRVGERVDGASDGDQEHRGDRGEEEGGGAPRSVDVESGAAACEPGDEHDRAEQQEGVDDVDAVGEHPPPRRVIIDPAEPHEGSSDQDLQHQKPGCPERRGPDAVPAAVELPGADE